MGRIGLADVRHNACAKVKLWRPRERAGRPASSGAGVGRALRLLFDVRVVVVPCKPQKLPLHRVDLVVLRANRRAPKKSHTATVNYATDGGRAVCLSAANRPLMRVWHCASGAFVFEISG